MLLTEFDQKSYDSGLIKVGVEQERYEKCVNDYHEFSSRKHSKTL